VLDEAGGVAVDLRARVSKVIDCFREGEESGRRSGGEREEKGERREGVCGAQKGKFRNKLGRGDYAPQVKIY
jgi:hypothetical protein